jgi:hypothetical protein
MKMDKPQRIALAVGTLVSMLTAGLTAAYLKKRNDPSSLSNLEKAAGEIAKSLPMMVDKDTELYSVAAADKAIIYKYRLVHFAKQDVSIPDFIKAVKPGMAANNCGHPETRKQFLDRGVAMKYAYADKSMEYLAEIVITRADCE